MAPLPRLQLRWRSPEMLHVQYTPSSADVDGRSPVSHCETSVTPAFESPLAFRTVTRAETSSAEVQIPAPWHAELLHKAKLLKHQVSRQALDILPQLQAANYFPPEIYSTESGALVLEWIATNGRLAIFLEPEYGDSGWALVGPDLRNGLLSEFTPNMFSLLRR